MGCWVRGLGLRLRLRRFWVKGYGSMLRFRVQGLGLGFRALVDQDLFVLLGVVQEIRW